VEPLKVLEAQRLGLMKQHPGWRIWFVPHALDGSVTWCAQPEPTIHAYSRDDLSKDIRLAEADLAARLAVAPGIQETGDPGRDPAVQVPADPGVGGAGRSRA
jgi:hypothetical protein